MDVTITTELQEIVVNDQQSETTATTLDAVIRRCGDLGLFQFIHFFFLNMFAVSAGIVAYYYVYGAAEPEHRCRLPSSVWPNDQYKIVNLTHEKLIDLWIPKNDKCHIYTSDREKVDCGSDGWVYDRSVYGFTFTEAVQMICKSRAKRSTIATVMQSGGLSALFIGSLSDKFGRKMVARWLILVIFVTSVLTQIAMQWIPMSVNAKFGVLLLNHFTAGSIQSLFSIVFVLLLELTSSSHASLAGNSAQVGFALGEAFQTLFAYLSKNWQILKWTNLLFIGVSLPYLYFMPESPLFLYSKNEYTKLEQLLRKMAHLNKRKESDWYPYFQEFIGAQSLRVVAQNKLSFIQKSKRVLSQRATIYKLLIIGAIGFITLLLYIKISYGLADMQGISPYVGILIGAAVEVAGYISGSILLTTRLGRKYAFIVFTALTLLCVLIIPFLMKQHPLPTVIIAQLGKYAISGSVCVSWIYVPELFPTSIRGSANGFFTATNRAGAILAAVIDSSIGEKYIRITFYVYSAFALLLFINMIFSYDKKYFFTSG
ncbi:unnamed protein product [Didymodactylos carnosus]|uniref:Major facilitator superfamily (MFS) profile domain-containing protein n=1 Tax=Didymodactylos carnosus TaxID=1234261 RepID=A0A814JBZ9_9BILA|nr:unnamed protein product [Didymodactylos carnosus]CAF3806783.1 unnamed protein product [Didymodactylos carnosus]